MTASDWCSRGARDQRQHRQENVTGELLHGGEECVHGDSAYHSNELQAQPEARGMEFKANVHGNQAPPADRGAEGA